QIECVSCKEIFIVSEDYGGTPNGHSDHWHMPAEGPAHTDMHYHAPVAMQRVNPPPRAVAQINPSPILTWDRSQRAAINCPRCGTDNRNWLRLAYAPLPASRLDALKLNFKRYSLTTIGGIVSLILMVLLIYRASNSKQPLAYLPMIICTFLVGFISVFSIPANWQRVREHRIVTTYNKSLPFFDQIPPALRQGLLYLGVFVFLIPFVAYWLLPNLLSLARPAEKSLARRIDETLVALDEGNLKSLAMEHSTQIIPAENAVLSLKDMLEENQLLCDSAVVGPMIANLESIKQQNLGKETDPLVNEAIASLRRLQTTENAYECDSAKVTAAVWALGQLLQSRWDQCDTLTPTSPGSVAQLMPDTAPPETATPDPIKAGVCNQAAVIAMVSYIQTLGSPEKYALTGDLPVDIKKILQEVRLLVQETENPQIHNLAAAELAVLDSVITYANNGPDTSLSMVTIFSTWFKFVGVSGLVAVITAVVATNSYVNQVNAHLPRPLCSNISKLTRVVMCEARQSLEINGNFDRIEWSQARRNAQGGINLKGHLCPPSNGEPEEQNGRVRAICYTLESDLWGHIKKVEAHFVRIPPSVYHAWDNHRQNGNGGNGGNSQNSGSIDDVAHQLFSQEKQRHDRE
ncbi:MAG: hypothetical protein R6X34_24250, partial [Chloroflexota bacterium]